MFTILASYLTTEQATNHQGTCSFTDTSIAVSGGRHLGVSVMCKSVDFTNVIASYVATLATAQE